MSDVFISYSRLDKEFVAKLRDALLDQKQEVWIDWESIPPSQAWWVEIQKGIARANNFVVVLSPNSMASPICQMEIEYARQLKKRIIPVLYEDYARGACIASISTRLANPDQETTREIWAARQPYDLYDANDSELKHINFFMFKADADFTTRFDELFKIIRTDYAFKEAHTTLELRAQEWSRRRRNASFLLIYDELTQAQTWLDESTAKVPPPTGLQREYIAASARRTRQLRNIQRGGIFAGFLAGIALIFAIGASVVGVQAVRQSNAAETSVGNANATLTPIAFAIATSQSQSQSFAFAAKAESVIQNPNLSKNTAILLAIRGLKAAYSPDADAALVKALDIEQERIGLAGHTDSVQSAVYSPNGRTILTASKDNTTVIAS